MKNYSTSTKIQLFVLIITIASIIYKVGAAESRITSLETDNKELKSRLTNIDNNVTALYLKFIKP